MGRTNAPGAKGYPASGLQNTVLIIVCLIVVGIATSIGISKFNAQRTQANKDGMALSLGQLAADAYEFKNKAATFGGGGGAYDNSKGASAAYSIPSQSTRNTYGSYSLIMVSAQFCTIKGISSMDSGWCATCIVKEDGTSSISYDGW